MFDYKVLESKPIPMAKALELLKKYKSKEMSFEEKQALEHLKLVLSDSKTPFNKEELQQIEEIVKKYVK